MRNIIIGLLGLGILSFSACNLEQEIELDIPASEQVVVVECYLEPGQPYTLLLTRSANYFDPFPTDQVAFIENLLETGASAQIIYKGDVIELEEGFFFNPLSQKFFNYGSAELVPEDFDNDFELEITTADGKKVTAITRITPPVLIDSVVVQVDNDTTAQALLYWPDNIDVANYYRVLLHENSRDSIPDLDITINDEVVESESIVIGTGPFYEVGDTLYTTLLHISEEYFNFAVSFQNAIASNGNPFGQPGGIISNVDGEGFIGIFTGFVYDYEETIIE